LDDHISVKNCEWFAPEILECITDSSGSTEKLWFLDDHDLEPAVVCADKMFDVVRTMVRIDDYP
jgi:hypothetical protein